MAVIGWIFSVILIAAGVVGTVVPLLPGAPLIFIGALLAAWPILLYANSACCG